MDHTSTSKKLPIADTLNRVIVRMALKRSATTVGGPGKGNPRGDGEPTWQRDQVSPYSPSPYFQTSWPQRTTGIRKDGLLELGKDILDTPAALSTVGSEDDDSLEDGRGREEKEEEDSFEKEDSDAHPYP